MKNIKTEEARLRKEIKKVKEAQEVFRKQPEVRGGMTDNPNIEDVEKWKEWYKKWVNFRKQNLGSDVLEAQLQQLLADKKMFQDAVEGLSVDLGNINGLVEGDLIRHTEHCIKKELLKTLGIQEEEK